MYDSIVLLYVVILQEKVEKMLDNAGMNREILTFSNMEVVT